MKYDIDKTYTMTELQALSHSDLLKLFKDAKKILWCLCLPKRIRKVNSDISIMRTLLK